MKIWCLEIGYKFDCHFLFTDCSTARCSWVSSFEERISKSSHVYMIRH